MVKMNVQTRQSDQAAALSNDLAVITAEINAYKRVAGEAIFEIGRRLKYVRDKIFKEHGHFSGKWAEWLREVDFDVTTAKRFIRVFEEFGSSSDTWHHLSMRALYEIATLPPEERERPHVIPSTGEVKTVDEMTVRELREVKAELKREREARQRAEAERDEAVESAQVLRDTLESMRDQTVFTDPNDFDRRIDSATSISELYVEIEHLLKTKLAPIKYSRALLERQDSDVVRENLRGIIGAVQAWCDEMLTYLPKENRKIIDAEVIEYEQPIA
jgi:PAS domain-containing protein